MKTFTAGLLCLIAQTAFAADHNSALKNYLTDDVVAVAYVDLSSIDTLGVLEWSGELGFVSDEQYGAAVQVAAAMQTQLDNLADAGVSHVYLLFRVSDISHGGPTWVVSIAEGGDTNAVLSMIEKWKKVLESPQLPKFWEAAKGVLLAGNTEPQLDKLKSTRPQTSRDLSDAWQSLGQGDIGIIIFGDRDSRRVVREMFPPLPEPFAALNGELIAEGLQWGGVTLKLPPHAAAEIAIETRDESTVESVQRLISTGLGTLSQLPWSKSLLDEAEIEKLVDTFSPQVEGTRLRIQLNEVIDDAERLAKLLAPTVKTMRQKHWRTNRINTFKNIGLAFHNYYFGATGALPAHANYDENGKALLSWRVHLLPFLEQKALYKLFHLDEPWDSEHNLPLAKILPSVYADFDPSMSKINAAGKTTYLVPTGFGTLFDGPKGKLFKEVVDGTSNTIMLVEVAPEHAVIWSQPVDWEVDYADPWAGLRREDREGFVALTCDAAAHYWDRSLDDDKLRALLTMAGEEVINWP